jgi:hypothetical protein
MLDDVLPAFGRWEVGNISAPALRIGNKASMTWESDRMTNGNQSSPNTPAAEREDLLRRLNKLFGAELWKAKADTSTAAFKALRALDEDNKKRDALGKNLSHWQDRVTSAIHKWVPEYVAFTQASNAVAVDKLEMGRRTSTEQTASPLHRARMV